MKKKDLLIVVIFIIFLTAPNCLYWIFQDKMDNNNYENRELYVKPELTIKNIVTFSKNYDNYYNDHIPFKNELRRMRSQILYKYFNTSSNSRVILGKDGWLFYNNLGDGIDTIKDYRKIEFYTKDEIEFIKLSLMKTKQRFDEEGIDFYVLVAPNKENVYSDYMPNMINRNNEVSYSRTEELINYLNENTDLSITYPKESLVDNRSYNETYYKYDTHWNNYGAYLGVMDLMKNIDSNFKSTKINIVQGDYSGDLANMNSLANKLINKEPNIEKFYDDIKYTCESNVGLMHCNSKNAIYDKTFLIVGDSFRENTVQYLAKIYENSIFIHRDYYNKEMIKNYKPDIVVLEAVERYSNSLSYNFFE